MRTLVVTLILFCLPSLALPAPSRADLDQLRKQINVLEKRLLKDQKQRDSASVELRRIETQVSDVAQQQRQLKQQQQQTNVKIHKLKQQQQVLVNENRQQLELLIRTIRASYMTGSQPTLKLLLNQEQPEKIARLLRYQDYFKAARHQRVEAIGEDLSQLQQLAIAMRSARTTLANQQKSLDRQHTRMEQARRERADTLALISSRIADQADALNRLRQDEAQLDTLLRDMRQTLNDIPAQPSGAPFASLNGHLPWPVKRKIRARFGSRREGPIRWNGVLLNTAVGTSVRAIHSGRVVFADWLRGYGLLTIVDHGNGYLSLYGYNQSLLRQVGEWVSIGDVLALAGDSGGRSEPGLYFEIRRDGKPVNPDKWCNSRVTLPPMARHDA